MLGKITDYWDSNARAIDSFAKEVGSLPPASQGATMRDLEAAVREHVRVIPAPLLPTVAMVVADDLYKAACWIDRWDDDLAGYLRASAGPFWSSFGERGYVLHQLIDNVFEDLARPLELFPEWFRSCGIIYVCPQSVAAVTGPRFSVHSL
jgi:hypothetical protein